MSGLKKPLGVQASLALGLVLSVVSVGGLAGCRGQTSDDPPIMPERNMYDTERYNPESFSAVLRRSPHDADARRGHHRARPLRRRPRGRDRPPPRQVRLRDDHSARGPTTRAGGIEKMLARGQERYTIYCTPCHGRTGDGKGMVVCKRDKVTDPCESRGFAPLPSYEDPSPQAHARRPALRHGDHHGVRTMPAYGRSDPGALDRWAIKVSLRPRASR